MNAPPSSPVILVADVTGSASLHQHLNAQEAERAIDRCLKRMLRSIEGYQGKVLESAGDEIAGLFPSAELACHSAIDMHQRIGDLPPVCGHKLSIRIALHDCDHPSQPSPSKMTSVMRLAGMARADQILCSAGVVHALPASDIVQHRARIDLPTPREGDETLSLFQILWPAPAVNQVVGHSLFGPLSNKQVDKLALRYMGKTVLLDANTPVVSLGRDPSCTILIQNRKVSRTHARIERRHDGFYLVDMSTNGTFLDMQGRQEILLRKHEILLEGEGRFFVGSASSDPATERVEFSHC